MKDAEQLMAAIEAWAAWQCAEDAAGGIIVCSLIRRIYGNSNVDANTQRVITRGRARNALSDAVAAHEAAAEHAAALQTAVNEAAAEFDRVMRETGG